MKLRKRIISVALAFCILTVSSVPAVAVNEFPAENITDTLPSTIYIDKKTDNEIELTNMQSITSVKATQTKWQELYKIDGSNQYVNLSDPNDPWLVDRLTINTESFSQNQPMFEEYNISENMINDIKETIEQQKENADLEVYIYAPASMDTPNASVSSTGPIYDTKEEIIEYRNMNTGYRDIARGSITVDICNTIFDILVGWAGALSKAISLLANGKAIISVFEGESITGTNEDFAQFKLLYDKLEKYTSVYAGLGWVVGCKSYKVWMDEGETYQYYADIKEESHTFKNFNDVTYSESYNNSEQVALVNFSNGMHVDDPLMFKIGSLTVYF